MKLKLHYIEFFEFLCFRVGENCQIFFFSNGPKTHLNQVPKMCTMVLRLGPSVEPMVVIFLWVFEGIFL